MSAVSGDAPAVKRKKSKNKFKQQDTVSHDKPLEAAAEPPQLHVASGRTAKRKNKKKRKNQQQHLEADETVAVQEDAPNALPSAATAAAAATAARSRPGSTVSPPAAGGSKKGKGGMH